MIEAEQSTMKCRDLFSHFNSLSSYNDKLVLSSTTSFPSFHSLMFRFSIANQLKKEVIAVAPLFDELLVLESLLGGSVDERVCSVKQMWSECGDLLKKMHDDLAQVSASLSFLFSLIISILFT